MIKRKQFREDRNILITEKVIFFSRSWLLKKLLLLQQFLN